MRLALLHFCTHWKFPRLPGADPTDTVARKTTADAGNAEHAVIAFAMRCAAPPNTTVGLWVPRAAMASGGLPDRDGVQKMEKLVGKEMVGACTKGVNHDLQNWRANHLRGQHADTLHRFLLGVQERDGGSDGVNVGNVTFETTGDGSSGSHSSSNLTRYAESRSPLRMALM